MPSGFGVGWGMRELRGYRWRLSGRHFGRCVIAQATAFGHNVRQSCPCHRRMKTLYALIDSPFPPDFRALYQEFGIAFERFDTARNLHRALQKMPPDYFVGEFVYGYGNNYAGANVSNLDVTLRTLQYFAPEAKQIVFMHEREEEHIDKLLDLFPVDVVLKYPVSEAQMRQVLQALA